MEENLIKLDVLALVPTYYGTKIIGKKKSIMSAKSTKYIINRLCKFYGSSLDGRLEGSRNVLGITYKVPIVISENKNIIMFPTESVRSNSCVWIKLDSVRSYYQKTKNFIEIVLVNNEKILIKTSYGIIDKQILRSARLSNILNRRRIENEENN